VLYEAIGSRRAGLWPCLSPWQLFLLIQRVIAHVSWDSNPETAGGSTSVQPVCYMWYATVTRALRLVNRLFAQGVARWTWASRPCWMMPAKRTNRTQDSAAVGGQLAYYV